MSAEVHHSQLISEVSAISGVSKAAIAKLCFRNAPKYRIFKIKSGSKYRKIKAPLPSLLLVQRAIAQILSRKLKVHKAAHGYVAQRSIVTHAASHLNSVCYLKSDIEDCFGSINSSRVIKIFREAGYSEADSQTAKYLTTDQNCLPQGAPCSPIICNLVLREVDAKLKDFSDSKLAIYTRYGDDLLISGEQICMEHIAIVKSILSSAGFHANSKKTYYAKDPKQNIVTGLSISTGVVRVRKSFKRLVRAEVHTVEKFGLVAASKRGNSFDPLFIERLIGKLSWWQSVEPEHTYPKIHLTKISDLLKRHDFLHFIGPHQLERANTAE